MMPRNLRARRRGAALVVALVALAIAGAVSASMLRIAVLRREHLQLVERRAQADWLLQSGIQRAAARLAADPQYPGETWQPAPLAAVTIRVQPVEERAGRGSPDPARARRGSPGPAEAADRRSPGNGTPPATRLKGDLTVENAGGVGRPAPSTASAPSTGSAPSRHRLDVSARYEQAGKAVKRSRQLVIESPTAGGRP